MSENNPIAIGFEKPTLFIRGEKSKYILIRIKTIGLFILLLTHNLSFSQNKTTQLDELIGRYAEYGQFNGSVLVAENGNVIYKKGLGFANMEWNIPLTSLTQCST